MSINVEGGELEPLCRATEALSGLPDDGQRGRVLRYLCDRFGVGNTAPISSRIALETAREEIRQLEIEAARIRVEHDYSDAVWERELDAAHAECEAKVAAERERCAGKVDRIILSKTWPSASVPAEKLELLADQIREGK